MTVLKGTTFTAPEPIHKAIMEVANDRSMNDAMVALHERMADFSTPLAWMFAALGSNEKARRHIDAAYDAVWADNAKRGLKGELPSYVPEIVVGAGLHAAIYCAVAVASGRPKPVVIERESRAGGAFAVSETPSFYLNSRNRPGVLSTPGDIYGALNVLPGAVVQPSEMGGSEYQTNADLAWIIRSTLALNAHVLTSTPLASHRRMGKFIQPFVEKATPTIPTQRLILATGLGRPRRVSTRSQSFRYLTFYDFMRRMDEPFPLRGMKRVAVIGRGDSMRSAVEALTGQGPHSGYSFAALDWPKVEVYAGPDASVGRTKADWERCNRSRYKGIARWLPVTIEGESRVTIRDELASFISSGYEAVIVNGRSYDHVIDCSGFISNELPDSPVEFYTVGGRRVARTLVDSVFTLGVAAQLPIAESEKLATPTLEVIPENVTSIFRYSGLTATLAASF